MRHEILGQQRETLRSLAHHSLSARVENALADGPSHLGHFVVGKTAQVDDFCFGVPRLGADHLEAGAHWLRPRGRQAQHPLSGGVPPGVLDDRERLPVSPVQVLEDEETSRLTPESPQEAEDPLVANQGLGGGGIRCLPLGHQRPEGCTKGPQRRVRWRRPVSEGGEERLGHGTERGSHGLDGPSSQDGDARGRGHRARLGGESRLPDSRLAR
jgi:hypothetical protein